MRLVLFVIGSLSAGTVGVKYGAIPVPDQVRDAVMRIHAGDPMALRDIWAVPVRAAYDRVTQELAKPRTPESLGFPTSTIPPADFSKMQALMNRPVPTVNTGLGSNVAAENQRFNDRMEDMRNYARNPAGWHGPPPR